MNTHVVKSYIWDDVETLPPHKMEELQVDRLRAGIDRVSKMGKRRKRLTKWSPRSHSTIGFSLRSFLSICAF